MKDVSAIIYELVGARVARRCHPDYSTFPSYTSVWGRVRAYVNTRVRFGGSFLENATRDRIKKHNSRL